MGKLQLPVFPGQRVGTSASRETQIGNMLNAPAPHKNQRPERLHSQNIYASIFCSTGDLRRGDPVIPRSKEGRYSSDDVIVEVELAKNEKTFYIVESEYLPQGEVGLALVLGISTFSIKGYSGGIGSVYKSARCREGELWALSDDTGPVRILKQAADQATFLMLLGHQEGEDAVYDGEFAITVETNDDGEAEYINVTKGRVSVRDEFGNGQGWNASLPEKRFALPASTYVSIYVACRFSAETGMTADYYTDEDMYDIENTTCHLLIGRVFVDDYDNYQVEQIYNSKKSASNNIKVHYMGNFACVRQPVSGGFDLETRVFGGGVMRLSGWGSCLAKTVSGTSAYLIGRFSGSEVTWEISSQSEQASSTVECINLNGHHSGDIYLMNRW